MTASTGGQPAVSVIVCTRDRPDDLEKCLPAILASDYADFELVVVDQSTDERSADLVRRTAAHDARVRLVRDPGKGLSRARNIGIAETTGELIVSTDDDCLPEHDWLSALVAGFRDYPEAGVAYGTVAPVAHDPRQGFIVAYAPPKRQCIGGKLAKLRDEGIGANMALRRAVLARTGGFDELLGAGGYFPSMEDQEFTYRVLAAGYGLLHVPESRVLHAGFRDWRSGGPLIRKTYVAIGAAYMKFVRRGDPVGPVLLLQQLWLAVENVVRCAAARRRPLGLGRLGGLLVGMWRSFELEVDPRLALYRPKAS